MCSRVLRVAGTLSKPGSGKDHVSREWQQSDKAAHTTQIHKQGGIMFKSDNFEDLRGYRETDGLYLAKWYVYSRRLILFTFLL